jgi:hypothetical protein
VYEPVGRCGSEFAEKLARLWHRFHSSEVDVLIVS